MHFSIKRLRDPGKSYDAYVSVVIVDNWKLFKPFNGCEEMNGSLLCQQCIADINAGLKPAVPLEILQSPLPSDDR